MSGNRLPLAAGAGRFTRTALALAVLTFTGSATASATPITYTEEGVVSGFLGGFSGYGGEFFAGDMIISWTGDTTNVMLTCPR
jgi:hypothetical protein